MRKRVLNFFPEIQRFSTMASESCLKRKMIVCNKAARPVAPYNQAIVVDRTVYVSGCLGLDPQTMKLVSEGIEFETRAALKGLKAILESAGSCIANVVKTTILLKNIEDFNSVNEVYKEFFNKDYPARTCYAVAKLPIGANVEIEAIAVTGLVESEIYSDAKQCTCK